MTENRQQIWDQYTGKKPDTIRHNFCDYDRYFEAGLIAEAIRPILAKSSRSWHNLRVLDFGCCAGDYGMYFARLGSQVEFKDIDNQALDFVDHRLKLEKILSGHFPEYDLAIYGEVLEHCDNALEILTGVIKNETEFIFTSSYPFRSDEANDSYWQGRDHSDKARIDQESCRFILEANYSKQNFGGQRNLWVRKQS